MPEVFRVFDGKDFDARIPAAYARNLAAPLPGFDEATPQAFRELAGVIGGPAPKKKDDVAKAGAAEVAKPLARRSAAWAPFGGGPHPRGVWGRASHRRAQ